MAFAKHIFRAAEKSAAAVSSLKHRYDANQNMRRAAELPGEEDARPGGVLALGRSTDVSADRDELTDTELALTMEPAAPTRRGLTWNSLLGFPPRRRRVSEAPSERSRLQGVQHGSHRIAAQERL
jgi:hypothetical protein